MKNELNKANRELDQHVFVNMTRRNVVFHNTLDLS